MGGQVFYWDSYEVASQLLRNATHTMETCTSVGYESGRVVEQRSFPREIDEFHT
jgi:hypothetical protein